jgi:ATP-binding cassette subfamily F protein 3
MAKTVALVEENAKGIPLIFVKHNRDTEGGMNCDLVIDKISVVYGGKTLLDETHLKLAGGRRYGLIGRNGIGKTCFMNALARS